MHTTILVEDAQGEATTIPIWTRLGDPGQSVYMLLHIKPARSAVESVIDGRVIRVVEPATILAFNRRYELLGGVIGLTWDEAASLPWIDQTWDDYRIGPWGGDAVWLVAPDPPSPT